MNAKKYLFLLFLCFGYGLVQSQDLPINSETKLVSLFKVIVTDTATKATLKQRVEEWVNLNSNAHLTLLNVEKNEKKKKKYKEESIPAFTAEKKSSTDEKLIYAISISNTNKIPPMAKEFANISTPPEFTMCNLIVLLKDGKMKYEFTNFMHYSLNPDCSGGKYENKVPDAPRKYMKRSYWDDVRLKSLEKIKLIAGSFEHYVSLPANAEMNF